MYCMMHAVRCAGCLLGTLSPLQTKPTHARQGSNGDDMVADVITAAAMEGGDAIPETDEREVYQNCALVIVDVQNDFTTGSLPVGADAEAVVQPINALRDSVRFGVVAHTQDTHPPDHVSFVDNHPGKTVFEHIRVRAPDGSTMDQIMWPRHCVEGSEGWKFHPELVVKPTDFIQQKGQDKAVDCYSGFESNDRTQSTATGFDRVCTSMDARAHTAASAARRTGRSFCAGSLLGATREPSVACPTGRMLNPCVFYWCLVSM